MSGVFNVSTPPGQEQILSQGHLREHILNLGGYGHLRLLSCRNKISILHQIIYTLRTVNVFVAGTRYLGPAKSLICTMRAASSALYPQFLRLRKTEIRRKIFASTSNVPYQCHRVARITGGVPLPLEVHCPCCSTRLPRRGKPEQVQSSVENDTKHI